MLSLALFYLFAVIISARRAHALPIYPDVGLEPQAGKKRERNHLNHLKITVMIDVYIFSNYVYMAQYDVCIYLVMFAIEGRHGHLIAG